MKFGHMFLAQKTILSFSATQSYNDIVAFPVHKVLPARAFSTRVYKK